MTWEEVQRLRKSGKYREAIKLALELKIHDSSIQLQRQLDWSWNGLIKDQVRVIESISSTNKWVPENQQQALIRLLQDYARQIKNRPDNSLSQIVREVSRIGKHLSDYPGFIRWVTMDGLGPKDWRYNEYQGHVYPPVALSVARELAKWCKSNPDAEPAKLDLALQWVERTRQIAHGDDALWIEWDRALLLRRSGDLAQAASSLSHVLKAKRNDFWVWQEAARIHLHEHPDLALACLCRALSCPGEEKFIVNVHVELAAMLAERGDFAQASREIDQAIAIRNRQGWRNSPKLQTLIEKVWYKPGASEACDPREFYAAHAPDALVLCFDNVQTIPGTFLGTIIPHSDNPPPGWKPRPLPRFAVRDELGKPWSIVAPGMRVAHIKPGNPVWLVEGVQEDGRKTIVQIAPRPDGQEWDCTDARQGIVRDKHGTENVIHVFLDRGESYCKLHASDIEAPESLQPGDGLQLRVATNLKRQRLEIAWAQRAQIPKHPDIQPLAGHLRRNPKGFAFVDDIFVAPPLVETLPNDVVHVTGIAVYAHKPNSEDYGWSAVTIRPE